MASGGSDEEKDKQETKKLLPANSDEGSIQDTDRSEQRPMPLKVPLSMDTEQDATASQDQATSVSSEEMPSQPDTGLGLDSVQDAIAEYVQHRLATSNILSSWAKDYANPWRKLAKVIRAFVPVMWITLFLYEFWSWVYPGNDTPDGESSTSVSLTILLLGVISQIVTLYQFERQPSHYYIGTAIRLGVVTVAVGISAQAFSWSLMDLVKMLAGLLCGNVFAIALFESVIKAIAFAAVAALTWYRMASRPFADPRPVVLRDIETTSRLRSALKRVYSLETVDEEKPLQLSGRGIPGLNVLESTVTTKSRSPNFLFTIVQLRKDISSSIASALRANKIPNSEVVEFVEDVIIELGYLNERHMKNQIGSLRGEIGIQ